MAASGLLAQVEGSVVNSTTGAPLAGAAIRILKEADVAYRSISGPQGEFRIEGMATGDYTAECYTVRPSSLPKSFHLK